MQEVLAQDYKTGNPIIVIFSVLAMGLAIGCGTAIWPTYTPMIVLCLTFGLAFICITLFSLETAVLIMIALFPFSSTLPVIHTGFFDIRLAYLLSFVVAIIFFLRFSVQKDLKIVKSPLNLPLLIFLLVNFLSIFVSIDTAWSIKEFVQLVHYVLTYFIVLNVVKDENCVKKALGVLLSMPL